MGNVATKDLDYLRYFLNLDIFPELNTDDELWDDLKEIDKYYCSSVQDAILYLHAHRNFFREQQERFSWYAGQITMRVVHINRMNVVSEKDSNK